MPLFGKKQPVPPRRHASTRLEEAGAKFRRSATLTGTRSDEIKATAEDRSQLQSARIEAQARRKVRKNLNRRIFIVILLLLAAGIMWLNRVSGYAVTFPGSPAAPPSTSAYIESAKLFRGTKITNQFSPTLDGQALAQFLMARHKEIASVAVRQAFLRSSPSLAITLRQPVLLWQTKKDDKAFYVDGSGTSFATNAYANDKQLVRVNDESGVPAELGAAVVSSRQIRFLGLLVGQVEQSSGGKLKVARIVFPPSSTKQIDVFLTGKPYFVKVYMERPAKAQAEEMVKSITYLTKKGVEPAEYLDVRVAEKTFYK